MAKAGESNPPAPNASEARRSPTTFGAAPASEAKSARDREGSRNRSRRAPARRDASRRAPGAPASAAKLARPEGVEPPAYRFEACRSIQLSYGRVV